MKEMLAFCGYDCNMCPVKCATENEDLDLVRRMLLNANEEETLHTIGCNGCRANDNVNKFCCSCSIRLCALEKNVENCGKCLNFPCDKLNSISGPTRDILKKINDEFKKEV